MRVSLHAKVETHDGHHAGSVHRAVVDPHANEVTEFVVGTGGFLGRDVLVPRAEIERAETDGDTIRLKLSKKELEDLPTYVPANYMLPPAGAALPLAYGFPESGFLWPVGLATAPGMGYGPFGPGAMGTTAGPSTTARVGAGVAYNGGQNSATGFPDGGQQMSDASLGKGALVVDSHGDDIGAVDEVLFDQEGGQLRGFILRVGGALRTLFGGGETVEVSAADVERVSEGLIHLRVSKDDLVPAHR